MTTIERAQAINACAAELLQEVKDGRTTLTLDQADQIQHIVREARGWLLSVERCLDP